MTGDLVSVLSPSLKFLPLKTKYVAAYERPEGNLQTPSPTPHADTTARTPLLSTPA